MNAASPAHYSLLVVDDEPDLRTLYELTLLREGYEVEAAGNVEDALLRLRDRTYSAVITDMRLPDGTGLDLLAHIEADGRREKAIVITAYGSAENAVEALKAGAYDYLTKPVDLRQFRAVVASALGRAPQLGPTVNPAVLPSSPSGSSAAASPSTPSPNEPSALAAAPHGEPAATRAPRSASAPQALARLRGSSPGIAQVRALIDKVARSMAPVLVHGESGTGKELVARAIHDVSSRAAHPFIAVNCGAIPEQLLEAEFFGYRKGSFTGANEDRAGFFQAAQGGTLFLDEIGDLPLAMQSKLLRVIQERSVRPVGAVMEMPVNVRIVSATHKDLTVEVQAGRFRQDLFYRLNVIQLHVPALRERLQDLPELCDAMLARIAGEARADSTPMLAGDAMNALRRYSFPGNVRELENLLHRAVALASTDVISAGDLGLPDVVLDDIDEQVDARIAQVQAASFHALAAEDAELPSDLAAYLDDIERRVLERALDLHRNNRTAAGASLGLTLRQMRYRMARLGVGAAGADAGES